MFQKSMSLRSFITAAWLGWQIESNWTDPFLFVTYSIVKPVSSAAILVVMYAIISQGDFQSPFFAYLFFGNAFYQYVPAVLSGVSWTIIDDREHYRTLKYIYIAPVKVPSFLAGRSVAKFLTSSFGVIITIVIGVLFLNVPFDLSLVNWPLLLISLVMGILMLALLGLLLAGITLISARHSYYIGDVVAGGFFLFTGAIFPLEILPTYLRPIGYALPITYWLELMRRSLVGDVAQAFPTFSALSNAQLLGILAVSSLVFSVLGYYVFKFCEKRARNLGLIDQATNY